MTTNVEGMNMVTLGGGGYLSNLSKCLFLGVFFLPKTVPYIRLVILSYPRFGLRGADNIAVTIEKSAMRPQA